MFPRDMVCLRNMSVDTLHEGDTEDDDDNDDDDDDDDDNLRIQYLNKTHQVYTMKCGQLIIDNQ